MSIPVGMDIVIVARSLLSEVRSQEYCEYMRKKGIPDINKMFCSFDAGKKMNRKKVFLHLSKMLEILLAFCHLRRYTVHAENNPGGVCHA